MPGTSVPLLSAAVIPSSSKNAATPLLIDVFGIVNVVVVELLVPESLNHTSRFPPVLLYVISFIVKDDHPTIVDVEE